MLYHAEVDAIIAAMIQLPTNCEATKCLGGVD